MPFYVGQAVTRAIADQPVKLRDAKVLILGAAFKRDVDDMRHSPALRVMEILCDQGICDISYSDPHVPELEVTLDGEPRRMSSVELTEESLASFDAVVIVTDHAAFNYDLIARASRAIVDTRNALQNIPHDRDKVYLLGGGNF
ncbi:MAG: UDP binding domain-containing protein, partial [Rhodothermales bacterium]|nr:UDP binding domain-containing protein [Rhodothermales bacterium]